MAYENDNKIGGRRTLLPEYVCRLVHWALLHLLLIKLFDIGGIHRLVVAALSRQDTSLHVFACGHSMGMTVNSFSKVKEDRNSLYCVYNCKPTLAWRAFSLNKDTNPENSHGS